MCRFTLVYILFATAVYRPGHGSLSPLALGLTVYVATVAGEAIPTHFTVAVALLYQYKAYLCRRVVLRMACDQSRYQGSVNSEQTVRCTKQGWAIRRWSLDGSKSEPRAPAGWPHRVWLQRKPYASCSSVIISSCYTCCNSSPSFSVPLEHA